MSEPIHFFLPGPTWVVEEVRRAMTAPAIGHRSGAFRDLYAECQPGLQGLFRTQQEVVVGTGSATLLMQAAIQSCVERRVLNLVCGAFSERWHVISSALGKEAERVAVPWGEPITLEKVREALRAGEYEAVTVVHNETSTGLMNPLPEISQVVHEESDALLLVDTVSSFAGAPLETDGWDLDIVVTGSQKALAIPPGLSFATLSERAIERMQGVSNRGFYTDFARYLKKHRKGDTLTTPAIPLFYALKVQLERIAAEGLEARWERHRQLRERTEAWVEAREWSYASSPEAPSWTVSCVRPPEGLEAPASVTAAEGLGVIVGGGYGEWKPTTIRIGHMGEVRLEDLERLLAALDEVTADAK